MKRSVTKLLFLFTLVLVLSLFLIIGFVNAITINVPADHATIQAAIDAATSGDTIDVGAGTYAENVVINNKQNLTIQGAGVNTIVQPANGIGFAISDSSNITINNLKIHTTGTDAHSIWVAGSSNGNNAMDSLTVQDTTIVVDGYSGGIYAAHSSPAHSNWLIGGVGHGNNITINSGTGVTGDGLDLHDVSNSEVSYNNLTLNNPTASTNILWTSELSNLNNLVLKYNTVSGSSGSEVAIVTDFLDALSDTSISTVTFLGNTFTNWGSRAIRVGKENGAGTVTGITINSNTFQMSADKEVIGGTATDKAGTGNTFNVGSASKIQRAINSSFSGDTITVAASTYDENIVIDNKQNIVIQTSDAVLAPTSGIGFAITDSDTITIKGFTINTTGENAHGIWVGGTPNSAARTTNLVIKDNTINVDGYSTGIYTEQVNPSHSGWTIGGSEHGNTIIITIGDGMDLHDLSESEVSYNTVTITDPTGDPRGSTNVLWTSETSNLTNLIFNNNNVSGSSGSEVAFISDFIVNDGDTSISTVTVSRNTFQKWGSRALRIGVRVTAVISSNNKFLSAGEALKNEDASQVNATNNYWGDATGSNQTGSGDTIVGNVLTTPWLDAADGNSRNYNVINVDTSNTYNTIQEAISAASSGETINVLSGTYKEAITINKPLTLQSQDRSKKALIDINTANTNAVTISSSNTTLNNLIINSEDVTSTPEGSYGIGVVVGGNNVNIINSSITSHGHGIWTSVSLSNLNILDNSIIVAAVSSGIYGSQASTQSNNWNIKRNIINAAHGVNIELYDVNNAVINNNTLEKSNYSNIVYSSEDSNYVQSLTISDNTIKGNNWPAIRPMIWIESDFITGDSSSYVTGITITGNEFGGWQNAAIQLGEVSADSGYSRINGTISINNNNFNDDSVALKSYTSTNTNAEKNYWATATPGNNVVGAVDYTPWYKTSSKLLLQGEVILAYNALDFADIHGSNTAENDITTKLNLIKAGLNDTKIDWKTNNSAVISVPNGNITRPQLNSPDANVNLSATISKTGHESMRKDFDVIVIAETTSDELAINNTREALIDALVLLDLSANPNMTYVTANLNLTTKGLDGASISWSSGNPTVVSTSGSVSRQSSDAAVTLTATISKGVKSTTKPFTVTVKGTTDPNEQAVSSGKIALTDSKILNGNSALNNILSNLYLPLNLTTPLVNITWSSSNPSVVSNNGVVTRPDADTEVTLEATITSNAVPGKKTFLLTVKQKPAPAVADSAGKVDVGSGETEIMIDSSNAAGISSISVPSTVSADATITLNLASLKSANNVTLGTNELNMSRATSTVKYDVIIPAGTTITGSANWNGLINMPAVKAISEVTPTASSGNQISSVDVVIEVGTITSLNFTKAVQLVLPGMAGKKAGFTDLNGDFYTISTCSSQGITDPDTLPVAGDCYNTTSNDLIIWTKHFTKFAAYTETATTTTGGGGGDGGGGGGGGGGGYVPPKPKAEEAPAANVTEEVPAEAAAEEAKEEVITPPAEAAPSRIAAITGAAIGIAKEALKNILNVNIWSKIIGGIVVLFVVIYLLYVVVFRSGAPLQLVSRGPNWYYNRASLLHRKAEEAYREGKKTKAEKLFKKAQSYRETGEHK